MTTPTYDCSTISDRVDAITREVAALHAELRQLSEQMQTLKPRRNEHRLVNRIFETPQETE